MGLLDDSISDKEHLIKFIDSLIRTSNPIILPDGSNPQDALTPRLDPSTTGYYGRLADEIQVNFENFKIGCRLKYSSFPFV